MHISRTRHMRSITGNTGCWWWPVSESDSSEDSIEVHHVRLAKFAEFSPILVKSTEKYTGNLLQIPSPGQQEVDTTGQIGGDGP